MNATTVGKSLIIINVILSMVFASWAVGVFTNRINWGGTPGVAGDAAISETGRRSQELKDANAAAAVALGNWKSGNLTLNQLENAYRPQARNWFNAKLKALEDGAQPITSLAYAADGRLQLGAEGKPIPGPDGQPLKARSAFRQAIAGVDAEIKQQNEQANKDLQAAEQLTIELNGVREGNLVKQKGLRDLKAEEELAHQNALAEIQYLRPFRFNRQAEGELLQKRQDSLAQRLEELKKVSAAFGKP